MSFKTELIDYFGHLDFNLEAREQVYVIPSGYISEEKVEEDNGLFFDGDIDEALDEDDRDEIYWFSGSDHLLESEIITEDNFIRLTDYGVAVGHDKHFTFAELENLVMQNRSDVSDTFATAIERIFDEIGKVDLT